MCTASNYQQSLRASVAATAARRNCTWSNGGATRTTRRLSTSGARSGTTAPLCDTKHHQATTTRTRQRWLVVGNEHCVTPLHHIASRDATYQSGYANHVALALRRRSRAHRTRTGRTQAHRHRRVRGCATPHVDKRFRTVECCCFELLLVRTGNTGRARRREGCRVERVRRASGLRRSALAAR